MVSCKPCKKKILSAVIPINEKEKVYYARMHQSNKDVIDTNYRLF